MSCAFRALPRIIPEVILAAAPGSDVFLISPWVEELMLSVPIIGTHGQWSARRSIYLSEFLLLIATEMRVTVTLVVREYSAKVRQVTNLMAGQWPASLQVHEERYLHAKAIVTHQMVLQMSANLIPTSLYRNIETCSLSVNIYRNSRHYVRNEMKLTL